MPQVPTLDNFSVAPAGGSGARVSAPAPRNVAPDQLASAGEAITRAGGVATDIFRDIQAQANQTRVDDAINKLKERAMALTFDKDEGFTNLKGIDALERPNGQSLGEEFGGMLGTSTDQIAGTLGNDVQRRAFAQAAAGLRVTFDTDIRRHESGEFRDYTLSVREGTIANAQREIGLKYNDPEATGRAIASIQASVYDQSRLLGKSATWAEAQARNMTSNAHRLAMASALEKNDIGFVESYLKLHTGEMNADDVIAIEGAVDKQKGMSYASDVAGEVFSGVGTGGVAPEAVGMPVAGGRVTSGYGARKAPTAGASSNHGGIDIAVPIGTRVSADASGTVVFAGKKGGYGNYVEVRHADGSVSFFAHLSGINVKVGDTIAKGANLGASGNSGTSTGPHLHWGMRNKDGKSIDPRSIRSVGGGANVGSNASLLDMIQAIRADPRLAGKPEWQAEAERQVRSLYAAREEGRDRAEEEATGSVMRELVNNGGKLTPQMASRVPDKALPGVLGFANSLQSAQRRDDNEGDPILWAGLKSAIASGQITNPGQLLQYAPRLSRNDFRSLTADVISIQSGDQKKIDSYTTVDRTLKYIRSEMLAAGIDWTPDNKDPDAAKKFGQFQSTLLRRIGNLEQVQGKPLTPDEARKVALGLLAEVPGTSGAGWAPWTWGSENKRGYELGGPAPLDQIPVAVQQRAAAALRAAGKRVTPFNIRWVVERPDQDITTMKLEK